MSEFRVAAIGMVSWDRIIVTDSYPAAGSYAVVRQVLEQSGGTTANTAHALARLGVNTSFVSVVGDDAEGRILRNVLEESGCDCRYVKVRDGEPSDSGIIVVSGAGGSLDRTIFWQQGARLMHGDALPINELFAHDLVILDVDDPRLRRFVVDLPMHVSPRTRILGTLTYLVEISPNDGLDVALRHDYLVGNQTELKYLTGQSDAYAAVQTLQSRMGYADTRLAAITLGAQGCIVASPTSLVTVPAFEVDAVDTTGAGDAFAAGVTLGILERLPPEGIGTLGNAMGALSIRKLGARSSLPDRVELDALLATRVTSPKPGS